MAREPPALLSSSELRDIDLQPTAVRNAKITIIHPQLRDLILPLERARVLYPRGSTIEESRWVPNSDEADVLDAPLKTGTTAARPFLKLGFTPNCLTASRSIIACGGQHGELHLTTLSGITGSAIKPFTLSMTLSSRSINNSMVVLPCWPGEWSRREEEKKLGFLGRGNRFWEEGEGRAEHGVWRKEHGGEEDEGDTMEGAYDDDEDEGEGIDEGDEDGDDFRVGSPLSASSVATYPNTVPFRHPPRIPNLPNSPLIPTRRTASFGAQERPVSDDRGRDRTARQSFSTSSHSRPPQPTYVTSRPRVTPPLPSSSSVTSSRRSRTRKSQEPRLLISNNDQTVKMFSLKSTGRKYRSGEEVPREQLPPPPTRFGGSGWDSIGLNEGLRSGEDQVRRERGGSEGLKEKEREERRLAKIGGTKFKLAVNHSSLSPDLKTMVTVGDSTDVFLFEVVEGGKEFRKIGVYTGTLSFVLDIQQLRLSFPGATDSGFSTSWSKDGRKFAAASQDGQVTVWDHRSSRPLAIFHTSPTAQPTPSFTSDISSSRHLHLSPRSSLSDGWEMPDMEGYPILVDPVTGAARLGSSTSGREAARVVKFSPEGSSRDLMVFSEESTNIHVVDAKTFNTHVVLPVPHSVTSTSERAQRVGIEGGTWGIAGVAFDPTGDWLYSGTERTIVEWDMRKYGGGEGGTWALA
ncbi:hypothetical protein P7C73_g2638, partial [Tremellales sp. Uapishka_1]